LLGSEEGCRLSQKLVVLLHVSEFAAQSFEFGAFIQIQLAGGLTGLVGVFGGDPFT